MWKIRWKNQNKCVHIDGYSLLNLFFTTCFKNMEYVWLWWWLNIQKHNQNHKDTNYIWSCVYVLFMYIFCTKPNKTIKRLCVRKFWSNLWCSFISKWLTVVCMKYICIKKGVCIIIFEKNIKEKIDSFYIGLGNHCALRHTTPAWSNPMTFW